MKPRNEIQAIATAFRGIPIWFCMPDSPAQRAGLRYGDICLEANGYPTDTPAKYATACAKAEEKIIMRILRAGTELEIVVDLREGHSYNADDVKRYVEASGIRPPRASPDKKKTYLC